MKNKITKTATLFCTWQITAMIGIVMLLASCNQFAKSDLAQSIQSFNEKSLPQQQAEGLEWTSLTYNQVLDQVVFLYTFDENYYDADEALASFNENKEELKANIAPLIAQQGKVIHFDGSSVKIVYKFPLSNKSFEILFTGEEVEQLTK